MYTSIDVSKPVHCVQGVTNACMILYVLFNLYKNVCMYTYTPVYTLSESSALKNDGSIVT